MLGIKIYIRPYPETNVIFYAGKYIFVLRVVLLLLAAWVTLLLFNTALIVVPVSLGRALFNDIPTLPITHGIKCNGNPSLVLHSLRRIHNCIMISS